jgi:hypothetical protein
VPFRALGRTPAGVLVRSSVVTSARLHPGTLGRARARTLVMMWQGTRVWALARALPQTHTKERGGPPRGCLFLACFT